MSSILEGELAETISTALQDAGIPYDVTITRVIPGEPDPEAPWEPVEDETVHYACKGFVETYSELLISSSVVQVNDVKVVILAPTIEITPELTDTVTVRGTTYEIINIGFDPALATIELQARS